MTARMLLGRLAVLVALAAAPGHGRAGTTGVTGRLSLTVTAVWVTPGGFRVQLEGTVAGRATVIGRLTGAFSYDLDPATGEFAGTLTKVAANGDEIHETFAGQRQHRLTGGRGVRSRRHGPVRRGDRGRAVHWHGHVGDERGPIRFAGRIPQGMAGRGTRPRTCLGVSTGWLAARSARGANDLIRGAGRAAS